MPEADPKPIDPVRAADEEAMMHAEALAMGMMNSEIWDHYWKRRTDDLLRRIDEHYGATERVAMGGGGEVGGGHTS